LKRCFPVVILLLLFGSLAAAQGPLQRVPYGIGSWQEAGRGNHRALVRISSQADAVRVRIPWRRRDANPQTKAVIIYDNLTGKQITNVVPVDIQQEHGDIVFQPATAPGTYEVYYLPYNPGKGNFDDAGTYFAPSNTADLEWLKRNHLQAELIHSGDWNKLPAAEVTEFQARNDFNRFDPMEICATSAEVRALLEKNPGADYLLFTEDRKFPIRMMEHLPLKWIDEGPHYSFTGNAQPGEYYVFQIGVWAARKPLNNVKLTMADLVSSNGARIPAKELTCINLSGTDWLGRPMTKVFDVSAGAVRAMWVGLQVPKTAKGVYSGELTFAAAGLAAHKIPVRIEVSGSMVKNNGDDDLWRLSRLRWLNSTLGIDDEVIPPFTPLHKKANRIDLVGRTIKYDPTGLPSSIKSNGREILSGPVTLTVKTSDGDTTWKSSKTKTLKEKPGTIEQISQSETSNIDLHVWSRTEADGVITYQADLTPKKDIETRDTVLQIPIDRNIAVYLMGFSHRGGYRPASLKWKWDINRTDNMVWIGDADAGLQVKLVEDKAIWDYNFKESGLPESWNNEGKGGCDVSEYGNTVLVNAYTGPRSLKAGQTLSLKFRFMITPCKPIDPAHWNWRYDRVGTAPGGNINYEYFWHGTDVNPNINYPFNETAKLKALVDKIRTPKIIHANPGSIVYPAKGNINTARGSVHLWATLNFDPTVVAPGDGTYNQGLFALQYADKSSVGLTWCIDDHGMRASMHDVSPSGSSFPVILPSNNPEWRKGSKVLVTMSWGDKLEIFVNGKLKNSTPFTGMIVRKLDDAVLWFGGEYTLDAIKISREPYTEGQAIAPILDKNTLLLDTFSNISGSRTKAEKMAGRSGRIVGVVKTAPDANGEAVEFSYKPEPQERMGVNIYYSVGNLSNHVYEMWPLRSLGDEIFKTTEAFIYSVEKTLFGQSGGGYPWLQEHLINGYVPGWRQPLPDGENDAAIAVNGISRWQNYYVQGLDYLMRNIGIDGLYLDGIGYDRETMKRVSKTMYRANPKSRINFHGGNNFDFADMRLSTANQYMEHLPYLSNLWFGELFDYNMPPDYWLVEISGIPFGLTSEMLNAENGGNAYRGMIYGMTGRLSFTAPAMWKLWDAFGIQTSEMLGYWSPKCPVKTNNPNVLATVYRKKGRSLISLAHWPSVKGRIKEQAITRPLSTPPVIDGRVDPVEWSSAAQLSCFKVADSDDLADQQTQVWVSSDANNLYLAFRCMTSGQKPLANHKANGESLWEDDSMEFFIQIDTQKPDYFQFIGNSASASFTGTNVGEKWTTNAQYKASVSADSWEGEIAIPLSDLKVNGKLDGRVIGFNACRDHQTPGKLGSSWNRVGTFYRIPSTFGTVEFSLEKAQTVQSLPAPVAKIETNKPIGVKLSFDWKALGINPEKAKLTAPGIDQFQGAASFMPDDEIPVEPTKGWLLILSE